MGRIVVEATIENGTDPSCRIVCDVLVDTGAAYLTLPNAWRPRLGQLAVYDTVEVETANQTVVTGDICGPILLRFGSFRQVLAEALFIDMEPAHGRHEALLGYIPLEQAQAVVDLAGHRLAKVDRVDLKRIAGRVVPPGRPRPSACGRATSAPLRHGQLRVGQNTREARRCAVVGRSTPVEAKNPRGAERVSPVRHLNDAQRPG